MDTSRSLAVRAAAAQSAASCASGGSGPRRSHSPAEEGATGICHAYAPDGRRVALLKILLTNHCIHDCAYCVNRRSSDVERSRFKVDEVVRLTLDYYRRGLVEGLFISSGVLVVDV